MALLRNSDLKLYLQIDIVVGCFNSALLVLWEVHHPAFKYNTQRLILTSKCSALACLVSNQLF